MCLSLQALLLGLEKDKLNKKMAFSFELSDTVSLVNNKGKATDLYIIIEKPNEEEHNYIVMGEQAEIITFSLSKMIPVKELQDKFTTPYER